MPPRGRVGPGGAQRHQAEEWGQAERRHHRAEGWGQAERRHRQADRGCCLPLARGSAPGGIHAAVVCRGGTRHRGLGRNVVPLRP